MNFVAYSNNVFTITGRVTTNGIGGLAGKAFSSIGDLTTGQRIASFFVATFALLLATRALLKVLRIVHALVWHTRAGQPPSPVADPGRPQSGSHPGGHGVT